MANDGNVGGLDYRINVGGDWKAELDAFEGRINKLKADAAKLGTTKYSAQRKDPVYDSALAVSDIEKKRASLQRNTNVLKDKGVQLDMQANKEARQAAGYADIQATARVRNAKLASELAVKEAQINQLMREQGISARKAAEQIGLTSAQAKQLKLSMWDIEHAARQFLFTFRRLVGILAVFTLARKFAQAIGAAVGQMVSFNAEMETAKTGIASILVSVGRVYDSQGNLVTGAEAFNSALAMSDDLIKKIRKDAIGSAATFESLVQSFQTAVGPGLSAGLDLDQVRVLSKRLSEAAITMGIPINQLSEEIRSLLQGTATARNTRIAALFGGAKEANEAIKNAKEQGKLFEVLQQKLEGVARGTDAAQKSFAVLNSDLKDSVQLLLAEGGIEYFGALKKAIDDFKRTLVEVDVKGDVVGVNQNALEIVREFSSALATIIRDFQEFAGLGTQASTLKAVLTAIAGIVKTLSPLLFSLFNSALIVLNAFLVPLSKALSWLGKIQDIVKSNKLGKAFYDILKYTAATTMYLKLWVFLLNRALLLAGVNGLAGAAKAAGKAWAAGGVALALAGKSLTIFNRLKASAVFLLTKTNLWVAALSAAAGIVAYIGNRYGWWEKLSKKISSNTSTIEDGYKKQQDLLMGNISEIEQGTKSTEEWREEIEGFERDLRKAKGLRGLVDDAKELGELIQDSISIASKETQSWTTQLGESEKAVSSLKKEIVDLESEIKNVDQRQFNRALGISERDVGISLGLDVSEMTDEQLDSYKKSLEKAADSFSKGLPMEDILGDLQRENAEALEKKKQNLIAKEQRLLDLKNQVAEVERNSLAVLELQNQIYAQNNIPKIKALESEQELLEARAALARLSAGFLGQGEAELVAAQATLEVEKASLKIAQMKREINLKTLRETLQTQLKRESESGRPVAGAEEYLADPSIAKSASATVQNIVREIKTLQKENTELVRIEMESIRMQTRELYEISLEASGKIADGFELAAIELSRSGVSTARLIADAIQTATDGIAGAFGSAFREFLATGQSVRTFFLNALGDVFLNVAQQFATTVAKNMIASLAGESLMKFLGMGAANAPLIASNAALVASINANTAALGGTIPATVANTAATTGDAAATTANTGGLLANTSALFANTASNIAGAIQWVFDLIAIVAGGITAIVTAIFGGATTTNTLLGTIITLLGVANGWLASIFSVSAADAAIPFKKGGIVPKGYAHGGEIGGFARPGNIPASDTVPAWLTPGEYVLPVAAVRKLGVGLLERLRSGSISPASFAAAASSAIGQGSTIRGFATGGMAGGTAPVVASGNRAVNVAFFDDRGAMKKWADSTEGELAILNVVRKNSYLFK